jgi:hypothetical protein
VSTPERDELAAEFPEVVEILLTGLPASPTERPGEHVWAAIAAEIGEQVDVAIPESGGAAEGVDLDLDGGGEGAVVLPIADRRRRVWGLPVAMVTAAAAVLLVGVPLVLSALSDGGPAPKRAELAALDGWNGDGEAVLEDHDLTVSVHGEQAPEGEFYELWLLEFEGEELQDLRSLGPIEVDQDGSFTVPDDVDLDHFDVVDVSIEPDDGDPDHSGQSVLRGDLVEA